MLQSRLELRLVKTEHFLKRWLSAIKEIAAREPSVVAARPDAFALKNSGLNAFLYADVGAELNGSILTTLSMIARLGQDPWEEAARWVGLPRAGVIDALADSIALMPLVPSVLAQGREVAERLAQLLPATTQSTAPPILQRQRQD